MAMQGYEQLEVYKLSFALALAVHKDSLDYPKIEQFGGLADQIRRSSKAVCANMAEGLSKRMSDADERKFLSIALGSAEETRVWLNFAGALGYLADERVTQLREEYQTVCRMLFGLMALRERKIA